MLQPISLVVIGAATALCEVTELVDAINARGKRFAIRGALDDNLSLHGAMVAGVKVLGDLSLARDLPEVRFVFAISSYQLRLKRVEILESLGVRRDQFVTLVHPRADVSPRASLGHGCTIYGNAFIGTGARLGDFCIVYGLAFVSPRSEFADFAIAAGLSFIGAKARLGQGAFAAGASVVAPGVSLGTGAMVALASAAFSDVPDGGMVRGNPAMPIEVAPVQATDL